MEKIILDTNILIELSRNNTEILNKITNINPDNLYITPVVYGEFIFGAQNKFQFDAYLKFIQKFKILNSNEKVDDIFIQLYNNFSLSHRPTIPDFLIAAISIYYDATLFTLNVKDFKFINNLKLYV